MNKVIIILVISFTYANAYLIRHKRGLWDPDVPEKTKVLQFTKMTPNDIEVADQNAQKSIFSQTVAFSNSLFQFENIVLAAYKVANYTPDLEHDKHADFWKKIIPTLVKSLKDDVKAHNLVVKSISSIRDLAITIQNAGELVLQAKGSAMSIQIAQKNIPLALQKLTNYSDQVSKMELSAFETFGNQTSEIFQLIGPDAVKFVEQRAEVEKQINEVYDNQAKTYTKLAMKEGELSSLNYMLSSTMTQLRGAQQALAETKNRTDVLEKINQEVDKTISSIPVTVPETITTTTNYRSGFLWFWSRSSTSTSTKLVQVPNPNRESEQKYYDNVIKARIERIKANEAEETAKQKVVDDLTNSVKQLTGNFTASHAELTALKDSLATRLKYFQQRIDNLTIDMKTINEKERNITSSIGLQGNSLIQCLTSVRQFSQTFGKGAKGYAPLVSILEGITAMVISDIEFLGSKEPADVFLADQRLLKKVGFLSNYTLVAERYLLSSNEFNNVATKIAKF